jgi:hypothetical protein
MMDYEIAKQAYLLEGCRFRRSYVFTMGVPFEKGILVRMEIYDKDIAGVPHFFHLVMPDPSKTYSKRAMGAIRRKNERLVRNAGLDLSVCADADALAALRQCS